MDRDTSGTTRDFLRWTEKSYTFGYGMATCDLFYLDSDGLWHWIVRYGDLEARGEHPDKEAAAYAGKCVTEALWHVPFE